MGKASKHIGSEYFSFPAIPSHNSWLDLLRAWAIILVLIRHGQKSVVHNGLISEQGVLSNIAMNGWVGVDLFLVLSGFLIGKGLLKRVKGGSIEVWPFLRARIFRIVPAYYAVLFLTAMNVFPGFFVAQENLNIRILYHLLFLQDYLPSDINVVFWSLGVEEKFYLLAPLLFFALARFKRARGAFLLLGLLFLLPSIARTAHYFLNPQDLSYSEFYQTYRKPFHFALEPLILGVAVSIANHHGLLKLSIRRAKQLLAVTGVVAIMWLGSHDFMREISPRDIILQPPMIAVLCALAVLASVPLKSLNVWFEPLWRVIARLSYVLYLVHFPLIPLSFYLSEGLGLIGFWSIYLALSCLLALILHFGVEKPFLQLKTIIEKRSLKVGRTAHVA